MDSEKIVHERLSNHTFFTTVYTTILSVWNSVRCRNHPMYHPCIYVPLTSSTSLFHKQWILCMLFASWGLSRRRSNRGNSHHCQIMSPAYNDTTFDEISANPSGRSKRGKQPVDLATRRKPNDKVCFSPHPLLLTPNDAPIDGGWVSVHVLIAFMLCDFLQRLVLIH